MLPGLNPKKLQEAMKQLGIKQEEIDASRVIIEKNDGKRLIIDEPSVVKINMQGNESLQITGPMREEDAEKYSKEDIKTVMEKTGASEKAAKAALEKADGDLAAAIMGLS